MSATGRRRARGRGRLARRLALVAAATALVLSSAPGARAQTTTSSVPAAAPLPVGLSLVSQTSWVPLGETFTMKLHIDNPKLAALPGAAILVSVYPSMTSRSGFDAAIHNGDLGSALYVPNTVPVASLPPDGHGNVTLTFGLRGSGVRPTININRHGVYPVKVQLVNTGVASGSFVTWLVAVDTSTPQPIEKKLSVAFVWQAVADPIALPDGSDDPKVVAQMRPGGRLDKIATLMGRSAGLRMSLVLGPETAVAWKRLGSHDPAIAAAFARVSATARRPSTEVLSEPFVPIDAAALDAAGLGSYLAGEYAAGATALHSAVGALTSPTAQSNFVDAVPTSDAVVDGLRNMLIDRVAVREQALTPIDHPFSPAQAYVLDTTGGDARIVATAPFIEDLFNGTDPSALRAERVVAALSEVAYETPSVARGIVLAMPARWNPDLATMNTVVTALRSLPLAQPATLDDLFSTISTEQALGTDVQRHLAPAEPAATPVDPDEYQNAASQLAGYRDVVGAKDPVVISGEAALVTSLSTSITPERAHEELARIESAVQAFTDGISADEKRITLTSRRADVPLSFENTLKPAREVTVRVHLESAKLLFPNGADQTVELKPGSNTVRFTVEARASGTFPMTISITSVNGRLAFGGGVHVTVRSAVFGGLAVWVTVAALVFLAGWWANHFRRTRRSRRRAAAGEPVPAAT